MKQEQYRKSMEEFLALDKGEKLPLNLTIRLLSDAKCSKEVKALSKAEKLASRPLSIQVPLEDNSIENVLLQIDPNYENANELKGLLTINNWIITFFIIVLSLTLPLILIFSSVFTYQGIATYAVLIAVVITCYLGIFVWANMDFFQKKTSIWIQRNN